MAYWTDLSSHTSSKPLSGMPQASTKTCNNPKTTATRERNGAHHRWTSWMWQDQLRPAWRCRLRWGSNTVLALHRETDHHLSLCSVKLSRQANGLLSGLLHPYQTPPVCPRYMAAWVNQVQVSALQCFMWHFSNIIIWCHQSATNCCLSWPRLPSFRPWNLSCARFGLLAFY